MWTTVNKLDGGKNEMGYAAFQRHEIPAPGDYIKNRGDGMHSGDESFHSKKKKMFFEKDGRSRILSGNFISTLWNR